MIEHFNVGLLEDVGVRIFLVERADEEGVDAEEVAKLFIEEGLLDVGTRGWRNPQLLRITLHTVSYKGDLP